MPKSINRGINQVTSEIALEGPKDSFNEVIEMNLELIKKRIKKDLEINELIIGNYTKTKIYILAIKSITNKKLLNNIIRKIKNIKIDGIIDSSNLKRYLREKHNAFPIIIESERPDKTCMALLSGKVVILTDNSPYSLIMPSFIYDFFHTTDDYYQSKLNRYFIRAVRVIAFLISIFTPAFYISVTTRNYNLIPLPLLLTLKAGRNLVPFPAYIEGLFMMISFEILKESDLRRSTTSNSSISILGGLILGNAAVAAGIVSPIMIIVIAISSISALIFQSIEFGNTIRFYQYNFLILSTLLGILGIIIGVIFLIISLLETNTFGYSYISLKKEKS